MGVDHIVHVFIGRKCSADEIEACKAKLADMNDPDTESIFDPELASTFQSEDGFPIFAFICGRAYEKDLLDCIDDAEWYVVFRYIETIEKWNQKSIPFSKLPHEKLDERYELFVLHDVN